MGLNQIKIIKVINADHNFRNYWEVSTIPQQQNAIRIHNQGPSNMQQQMLKYGPRVPQEESQSRTEDLRPKSRSTMNLKKPFQNFTVESMKAKSKTTE